MANKDLSFGCKIKVEYLTYYHWETGGEESYSKEDNLIIWVDWIASNGEVELDESDLSKAAPNWYIEELETYIKIIWHPVMIGDVMYYIRKKYWNNHSWFHSDRSKLIDLRSKERESIEWQYDECIDFVHALIPKS